MNQKIKALEEQCWEPGQFGPRWFNSTKFAELIVKECADAADMAYDARCSDVGDYVVEQLGYGVDVGASTWRIM